MSVNAGTAAVHGACLLPPTAAIELAGADVRGFLQSQLTSDVRNLQRHTSQLSAWCNPQGRVITTLRIVASGETLWLLLPADQARHVADRLRRFVLRADVAVTLHGGPLPGAGLRGAAGRTRLEDAGLPVPDGIDRVAGDEAAWVVRVAGEGERYEIYARPGAEPAGNPDPMPREGGDWRLGNIRAGLPVVGAVHRELFLPQMLNLDALAAVSFAKGCYPGQEIVARTQNLGRVKRRMLRFAAGAAPAPGSPVHAGREVAGSVIDSAPTPDGAELLAVIRLDCAGSPLTAAGGSDTLERLALPYPLPDGGVV